MRKPSKYEKETIVNFNEAEQEATIYTFNADSESGDRGDHRRSELRGFDESCL